MDIRDDLTANLLKKRIIRIDQDITEEICSEWIGQLLLLDMQGRDKKLPIVLLVNSFGGSLYAGMGFTDVMKTCECPIYTVCIGVAWSGGAQILAAGTKRFASENARIMVHGHNDNFGDRDITHDELMTHAKESRRCYTQLVKLWMGWTGLPRAKVVSLLKKDSYLFPVEAKKLNIIDEVGWSIHKLLK